MDYVRKHACLICDRISRIQAGQNPFFVAETRTGYVVLGDYQFFRGYTLLLSKQHKRELHELETGTRKAFLFEMSEIAAAVYRAFAPRKLNYELLGNTDEHLHWHVIPRYLDDPLPGKESGQIDVAIRKAPETRPSQNEIIVLKQRLLAELYKSPSLLVPSAGNQRLAA